MDSLLKEKLQSLIDKKQELMMCLVMSIKNIDVFASIIEKLKLLFSNRIQVAFIIKNGKIIIMYKDFCKIDNQFNISDSIPIKHQLNDSYELAHKRLTWDSDNMIFIDLCEDKSDPESAYRRKLMNNMRINIFEISSNDFQNILNSVDSKSVDVESKKKPIIIQRMVSESNKTRYGSKSLVKIPAICYECKCKDIFDECKCFENPTNTQITINEEPFQEGSLMYCFTGYEDTEGNLLSKVFKMFKIDLNIQAKETEAKLCVRMQHISKLLAEEYSKANPKLKICFTDLKFIKIKKEDKEEIYLMDDLLDGEYVKFTNNEFAKFGMHYDLIEFSHWTYDRTDKKMMVVDLQGIEIESKQHYKLTDPAIHSIEKQFGKTDFGTTGFNRFMLTHIGDCLRKQITNTSKAQEQEDNKIEYSCKKCKTYITNEKEFRMDSLIFNGKSAKLYKEAKNVLYGKPEWQDTRTGSRFLEETTCKTCKTVLGYHYMPNDFDSQKADCTVLVTELLRGSK